MKGRIASTARASLQVIKEQGIESFLRQAYGKLKRREWSVMHRASSLWEGYSGDARILAGIFDFTNEDIEKSNATLKANQRRIQIKTINWFLPDIENVYWGGIHTILRFADYFRAKKSVKNRMVAVCRRPQKDLRREIARGFPELANEIYVVGSLDELDKMPYSDASVCSLWTTAYFLLRFSKTKRKFYFIQDFEPLFYPAGSTYAQAEATYRFGFYGIANTVSLATLYSSYGGVAEFFNPCVDLELFRPPRDDSVTRPFTVFFYGRPGHPRNCFELGAQALTLVKRELGSEVRIVSAGGNWKPREFGLDGVVEQLGVVDYAETASLYRNCDVGVSMMVTAHPSYIPLQLMASGCLVISNHNPHTTWLLKDGKNCILTEASASAIAGAILAAYRIPKMRTRLTKAALETVTRQYSNWAPEMEKIYSYMREPSRSIGK